MPRVKGWTAAAPLLLLALAGCGRGLPTRPEPETPAPLIPSAGPGTLAAPPPANGAEPAARPEADQASPDIPASEPTGPAVAGPAPEAVLHRWPLVWGTAGLRGYALGQQTAPNGQEYDQLFALDLNFNCWLWQAQGLYLFSDARFWGQKATAGVTNANQGVFDFSKRELDFDLGLAWNYYGPLEARAFAYSFSNLNRGTSLTQPSGYADGVGLENRLYLGHEYAELGTEFFDVARAPFVSLGCYPTKELIDGAGQPFKPGPFARAYVTWDLWGERCYLFADGQFTAKQSFTAKLLQLDAGVAVRPFVQASRVEFRLGTQDTYDLQWRDLELGLYGEVRIVY
jgi:hypothetical protein